MVSAHKVTDVGLIPKDWEVKPIGSFALTYSGGTPNTSNRSFYGGLINFIASGDLNKNRIKEVIGRITRQGLENSSAKMVEKNTLVIAMYGATAGVSAITEIEAAINQAVLAIIPTDVNHEYLFYWWQLHKETLVRTLTQGGQPNLSGNLIKSVQVPLPPTKAEQTAIATALNDADALIQLLEQLLTKKRNIKTGVMQELMRPKEGWSMTKVEKLGKPYGGLSGKSKSDFKDGNYPYIPFMNVMSNVTIDTKYFDYVKINSSENQHRALKGDLFFNGSSETPDELGMSSLLMEDIPNLYLNSFCFGFRLYKEAQNDGLYLAYFFRSSYGRKIFSILSQGATRHNLSKTNFMKIEIQIPSSTEQKRIAQILSDIDKEIFKLENQISKYKLIKQGMMQNLLTGKIRLV